MSESGEASSVAVVGGGLAGLAAASALALHGANLHGPNLRIELFEARRTLGGRAGSFLDPETGQPLDHCQHVGLGCCTNLADFCRRTGVDHLFQRHRVLHFFGPDGRRCDLSATAWLPAPLHLAPSLLRLSYLTLGERLGIGRAMLRLARSRASAAGDEPDFGHWLREQRQSPAAIDRFWSVVIVSALSESVDAVALSAARKVFVDGFLAHRRAYEVDVPACSLGELYTEHVARRLQQPGVVLHLGRGAASLLVEGDRVRGIATSDGAELPFDAVIAAVPWRRAAELVPEGLRAAVPELEGIGRLDSAPITAVHLWFDRPLTALPHAVLIGRLSQWVFAHGPQPLAGQHETSDSEAHYYQVVISASRQLAERDRADVVAEVQRDLAALWPQAKSARLLRWRMITQHEAVFSPRPGVERVRPAQQSSLDGLFWAGDWTRTGWPATMEGAVRSGYLAAEAVLRRFGQEASILAPDLPRNLLARWLCGASS
jgi:squalene-associated FAD-dependent desaturase